jgi:PAS domain S-box-containing protein
MKIKERFMDVFVKRMVLVGTILGLFYWVFISFMHFYFLHRDRFFDLLLTTDPYELSERSAVLLFFILFGFSGKFIFNSFRKKHKRLLFQKSVSEAINRVLQETLKCEKNKGVAYKCLDVARELTESRFGIIKGEIDARDFEAISKENSRTEPPKNSDAEAIKIREEAEKKGFFDEVITHGKSLIVNATGTDFNGTEKPEGNTAISSFMGVPLKKKGKIFGIIALANRQKGYSLKDQQAVEALSVAFVEALERKRKEEKLMESEETARSLLYTPHDAIVLLEEKGLILDLNETTAKRFRRKREDLIGSCFFDLFPEEISEEIKGHIDEAFRTGEPVRFESEFNEMWDDVVVCPISDAKGTITKVAVTAHDITDLKKAEDEIKIKTKQLRVLYETGKRITSMVSSEKLLPWIARQAVRLLEADASTYRLREEDYLVCGGGTKEGMELIVKERIKIGESLSGIIAQTKEPLVIRDIREDDRYIEEHKKMAVSLGFVSYLGVPMMIQDRLVGVINVLTKEPRRFFQRDIELLSSFADHAAIAIENSRLFEDLAKTKEELTESSKELEKKVEERTEELKEMHNQLLHSERLAATGRLGASVAHEINNPLQAIESFISLVMNHLEEGSEDRMYLKLADEGIDRIARIVKQLSSFYRPEKERRMFFDINTIVEKAIALTQNQLSINRIRVVKDFSPKLPPVQVSSQQMNQVLVNMILNAQDAMPEGGKLIITTRREDESICIDVRDTGMGIPEKNLGHVFEPVFTTKKESGTGLGLSVSYGIIRAHGGNINIQSKEDEGTTFTITLPLNGQ